MTEREIPESVVHPDSSYHLAAGTWACQAVGVARMHRSGRCDRLSSCMLQLDMIGQLVAIDGQLLLLGLEEIQILEIIQHLMGGLVFL